MSLYVPAESVPKYKAADGWKEFENIYPIAVEITGIKLDQSSASVQLDGSLTLIATVEPENAADQTVTWTSSDESVATVDETGKVTPLKIGKTVITAAVGEFSATCEVTVVETPATGVEIDKEALGITGKNLVMNVGDVKSIKVTIEPSTATDKAVTFTSSSPAIATVNEEGTVTALTAGETTITITAKSGVSTQITVTVKTVPSASITLNETKVTLKDSETFELVATILPENTTDKTVTWTSSDEAVATVDANGLVTAVKSGKAVITATNGDASATCEVTVVETPATGVEIDKEALGITGKNLVMNVGDVKTIKVTIEPSTATDKAGTFTSSSPAIATVNEEGTVTALTAGETTITITAKSGVSTQITVTVKTVPTTSITLNETKVTLKDSETLELVATILPENTTDKTVTWTSSDEAVATVDANGLVTAVKSGKAVITATNGDASATCEVTVVETPATGVEIDKEALGITGNNLVMNVGDVKAIKVTIEPSTATDKAVTFTSSSPAIATVNEEGTVTAIAAGETTITITAKSGVSTQITVTVKTVPSTSITLNETKVTLKDSETLELVATILPENTTDKTVTWASSDEAVATVDANGIVTAVKSGKAVITATNGDASATCEVTVVETPATEVEIDKEALGITGDNLVMNVGDVKTIKVTIEPSTATDKAVTFTSSSPAIATVDEEGTVTALTAGETTITITAKSGVSTQITVTVKTVPSASITLSKEEVTLGEGEILKLVATILPANTTDKTLTWSSSDTEVATVVDGEVTAGKVGTATITAETADGHKATCTVTVKANIIATTGVTLDITKKSLTEGETFTLTATVAPENATDKTVTWSSSDTEVAKVVDGVVTAGNVGTTIITVETFNGLTATCEVTVVETPATGVEIDKEALGITGNNLVMKVGDVKAIKVTIEPSTTTDKAVTFASSSPEIATVDEEGTVTALAAGETTITITAKSGASTQITVTVEAVPSTSITLNKTEETLEENETLQLVATILPENTTDKTVTWSSSDETVATVADGVVTALKAGTATITAVTSNGLKATCEVTVTAKEVLATSISLNKESIEETVGTVVQLTATVLPDDATDKSVTWSSSDEGVATVDNSGKVTILGLGNATITATTADGSNLSAVCRIYGVSGIEAIIVEAGSADVYSISGILLKRNADREFISTLANGVYIIRTGGKTYKIVR